MNLPPLGNKVAQFTLATRLAALNLSWSLENAPNTKETPVKELSSIEVVEGHVDVFKIFVIVRIAVVSSSLNTSNFIVVVCEEQENAEFVNGEKENVLKFPLYLVFLVVPVDTPLVWKSVSILQSPVPKFPDTTLDVYDCVVGNEIYLSDPDASIVGLNTST